MSLCVHLHVCVHMGACAHAYVCAGVHVCLRGPTVVGKEKCGASVRPSLLALEVALFLPLCVCVFFCLSLSVSGCLCLCVALSLSVSPLCGSLFSSGASVSLPLSSLPPLGFLSAQEEACKGPPFSLHPPTASPPHSLPRFFLSSLFKADKVRTAAPS